MLGYYELRKEIEEETVFVKDEPISEASEGEDDGNDWKNFENVHDEQVKVEDHETDTGTSSTKVKRKNRNCAYCFQLVIETDMMAVPKSAARRKEWIDLLGKQFESVVKNKHAPYVCKKHIDLETRLPKAEAIYDDRKFEIKPQQPHEKGSVRVNQSICCYCGAKDFRKKMKSVPTIPEKRELWIQSLGEQFRENIEKSAYGAICNSHFPKSFILPTGKVSSFALPIPYGGSLNKVDQDNTSPITTNMGCKCAYCGKHDFSGKMVPVPEGPTRDSWCYILGERFAMNLTKSKYLYICTSHFNDEKPTKDSIPCVEDSLECIETDNLPQKILRFTCSYCCAWLENDHTITVHLTPSRLETWCDILGEEFEYNVFRMGTARMCEIHFRREDFVDTTYRSIKDQAMPIAIRAASRRRDSVLMNTKKCLYCNKFQKYRKMIRILYDRSRWHRWTEAFGPDFDESFWEQPNNLPAVCRIHLTEKGLPLSFVNFQDLGRIALEAQVDSSLSQVKEEPMDEHKPYESSIPGCSTGPETMSYYSTNELLEHNYANFS